MIHWYNDQLDAHCEYDAIALIQIVTHHYLKSYFVLTITGSIELVLYYHRRLTD